MHLTKWLKIGCLLSIIISFVYAQENTESPSEHPQESDLIQQIRKADSLFYQGVSLWSSNADEASKFLKRACDSKHPGACLYLGSYYEQKSSQKRSNIAPNESKKYYQLGFENSVQACQQGAAEWCVTQAVSLVDGRGVTQDIQKGFDFLETMCEQNMEGACAVLGSYYFYGLNVTQDLQKAQELHLKTLELDSKSCEENRMYACVLSAEIYEKGLSVPPNTTKAKELYRSACALHNQFACDYVRNLP